MTRPRTLAAAGLGAVFVLALSACSTITTGTASLGSASSRPQIPTDQPGPATSEVTSSSPTIPSPLAGIDPCSVVPPATVTQFGATGPDEQKKLGIARYCSWKPPGRPGFAIAFFDTAGLKDATGQGPQTSVTVGTGKHDAIEQDRGGVCAVTIAMGVTSRVDVQVATATSACDKAKTLADAVEPLLPPQVK